MNEIDSLLKTRWLGRKYYYTEETASTSTLCYELAEKGAPMGTVVVADVQTQGREEKAAPGNRRRAVYGFPSCCVRHLHRRKPPR